MSILTLICEHFFMCFDASVRVLETWRILHLIGCREVLTQRFRLNHQTLYASGRIEIRYHCLNLSTSQPQTLPYSTCLENNLTTDPIAFAVVLYEVPRRYQDVAGEP